MKNKKIKSTQTNHGFTIIEVLAVIFVISFGLLGVVSLINQNVRAGYINHNTIIASQLCQESLELARNIRDNNWLSGDDWKNGSAASNDIVQDRTYAIDYQGILDVADIDDPLAKLYIDSNGFYRHFVAPGSATATIFSRVINVKEENSDNLTLECLVQWPTGENKNKFTSQTVLYDWR